MSDYNHRGPYSHHPLPQQSAPDPSAQQSHNTTPYPASHSDDLKYITKYKELKRKVKDAEIDNDRLQLKVLKARKNIQRLRLERAILYERLAILPRSDVAPFPSDPSIFTAPAPQESRPEHHSNETDIEYAPRDTWRPNARNPLPRGPSIAPPRNAHHAEEPPRAGPSRSYQPAPESEPDPAQKPIEGTRTYPFVLEYAQDPVAPAPVTAYPSEVRFYPYETATHATHRRRRGSETTEREIKFRHHRPDQETRSPRESYAFPMQHHFPSPEERHGQVPDETRRRERPNGARSRKDVQVRPREEYEQQDGQHPPPYRRGSYSQSEQEMDQHGHERRRRHSLEREGGIPLRMPENEAMD